MSEKHCHWDKCPHGSECVHAVEHKSVNEQIREHVQPLIDAFQVDEKIRKRYRDGH